MIGARSSAHEGSLTAAAPVRPRRPVEAPAIDLPASAALPPSVLALQRQAGNRAVSRMIAQRTIQRVRIRLEPGKDTALMDRLRQVSLPNSGVQTLDDPKGINALKTIGVDENIIFEGHGNPDAVDVWARDFVGNFGITMKADVLEQGGFAPDKLAALAYDVPKPDDWRGHIILNGCSTGDITSEVSKEYFKLAKKPVTVMGTLLNIKVGMASDGSSFIGSEWTKYPEADRPADLEFVTALQAATKDFRDAASELFAIVSQGNRFITKVNDQRRPFMDKAQKDAESGRQPSGTLPDLREATADVGQLAQRARRIIDIDLETKYTGMRLQGRDYLLDTREQMHDLFEDVALKLQASTIWKPNEFYAPGFPRFDFADIKSKVLALTKVASSEYPVVATAAQTMADGESKLRGELTYKLLGLALKPIDITDPAQAKHSRMEREKGTFRDTWVDRAAPQPVATTSATSRLGQAFSF